MRADGVIIGRVEWDFGARQAKQVDAPKEEHVADIRVICAIGQRGQLGLNGGLPWEGNGEPEYVADVARFFDLSRGHVLLVGPQTYAIDPRLCFRRAHDRRNPLLDAAAGRDRQDSRIA